MSVMCLLMYAVLGESLRPASLQVRLANAENGANEGVEARVAGLVLLRDWSDKLSEECWVALLVPGNGA